MRVVKYWNTGSNLVHVSTLKYSRSGWMGVWWPGLVEDVSGHCRGLDLDAFWTSPPTLLFYDSTIIQRISVVLLVVKVVSDKNYVSSWRKASSKRSYTAQILEKYYIIMQMITVSYHIRFSSYFKLILAITLVNHINHNLRIHLPMDDNQLITQKFNELKKSISFSSRDKCLLSKICNWDMPQSIKKICLMRSTFPSQKLLGPKACSFVRTDLLM